MKNKKLTLTKEQKERIQKIEEFPLNERDIPVKSIVIPKKTKNEKDN